jgi:beta-phosphoglucomutase-like phosphatase (HAD superfamily)
MGSSIGVVFDLDGTLVDSVYQHVLAWHEALQQEGIELSVWRIHRKIGMSGGLFAKALLRETGRELDPGTTARLQQLHVEASLRRIEQVRPLPGAKQLLGYLTEARSASEAHPDEITQKFIRGALSKAGPAGV